MATRGNSRYWGKELSKIRKSEITIKLPFCHPWITEKGREKQGERYFPETKKS